jgi:hypothetical protein
MPVFEIFSKRQKRLRGEFPDVYTYDSIPHPFRAQVVHIWGDALGTLVDYWQNSNVQQAYKIVVEVLRREYGVFALPPSRPTAPDNQNYYAEACQFLLEERVYEKVLDIIEVSFRAIDKITRDGGYLKRYSRYDEIADDAIAELNARFREHGLGYEFVSGEIIRIDSQLMHSEVVKPALSLLSSRGYSGAQEEFLKAHEYYRKGNAKEAINECLKSFESTTKAICDRRGWAYPPNATSKPLIDICFRNGLVPDFWQGEFAALRSLLESGVPTGRNRTSGHGQGARPVEVPPHIAGYILHMTAAAIVFLARADEALK